LARPASPSLATARPLSVDDGIRTVSTPSGVVEIYSKDPAFVVAVAGRYLIQIVKDRVTSTTVSLIGRALADLSVRHDRFGFVAVLEPHAQLLMAPDIRSGFSGLVKRYSPRFTGAAIIYERTGFQATAVRSVVTAINFASRASHPNHVFADARAGLYWLSKLTPAELAPAGLFQIVQQLRQSLQNGS
jgi:hypothetical protein